MEPEVAERFERIEKNLEHLTQAMAGVVVVIDVTGRQVATVAESAASLAVLLTEQARAANERMQAADERMTRIEESLIRYIDASNERMKRLEENLDGLIRAITTEHQNGRSEPQ